MGEISCAIFDSVEKHISTKLLSLIDSAGSIRTVAETTSYEPTCTPITPADQEVLKVLPTALGQYKLLLESLSDEWKRLMDTNTDLGTVTSYAGSVFNPQEIPLVQVVHCIISDMEMLFNEVSTSLSATPINYTDVINKIYAVICTSKFLCQTTSKKETRPFPSQEIEMHLTEFIQTLPDFEKRLLLT